MKDKRYLCSDLLPLRSTGQWSGWANLEEIWGTGAVLESETEIPIGLKLVMQKGDSKIWASVVCNEPHKFGCRVEVRFLFDYVWTPEAFLPEHLLDPDHVRTKQESSEV